MSIYRIMFHCCLAGVGFALFSIARFWSDWPDASQVMAVIHVAVMIFLAVTWREWGKHHDS